MSFDFKTSLLQSAKEALQISKGELSAAKSHQIFIPEDIDVKEIRLKLNITRGEFCEKYGFKLRTLEKWEQKVTRPDSATRAYLTVISCNPEIVHQSLQQHRL
ncbi:MULTISPECIES: helix-turn-helix domain-containing protein [Cysteiniphilum]|uniref:Transcriptional regulator n=1 Tax=Cysteiniphilum litorale TaxID=2056700 RepID=A0A8J2Z1G4_9GAMM|nr:MULTISPECIES: transcriptional regulator [Cysteiniphilum]GGF86779.1 hypothetical protein GCM10010995_00130 [Cysteiniphilum litorale]